MPFDAGSLISFLTLDSSQFNKSIDQTKKKSEQLDGQTKKTNKLFQNLSATTKGLALTFGAGLGMAAAVKAFGSVVNAAREFEKGMTNVSTLVDTAIVDMDALREGVLDMSTEVTKSTEDLTSGLFQVISAGIDSADALDVLRVAAIAATAGVTDTGSSVKAITGILNAYGLEANEATRISDLLFQTNKFGVTTFGELANSVGKVIPVSASLGIKLEDLFAAIATLTKANLSTSEATTALRAVFISILKPTDDAKKTAKKLGLEWTATALTSKGLVQFINDMKEATKGNTEQMAKLIPESTALTAVLALAGEQAETFNEIQGEMFESVGATTEAFIKQEETLDTQIKKLGILIDELKIKVGTVFLPTINSVLKGVLDTFNQVEQALENTDKSIIENISAWQLLLPQILLTELAAKKIVDTFKDIGKSTDNLTETQRKLREELRGLDFKKTFSEGDFKAVEQFLSEATKGMRDLVLETSKVTGANDDLAQAMKRVADAAKLSAGESTKAWKDFTDETKEAIESLGIVVAAQFQAETEDALEAFKLVAGAQELSNEDRIKLQEALFEKLRAMAEGIDPATALGFDPVEALEFLETASTQAADNLFTTTKTITDSSGKLITDLNSKAAKDADTFKVTLTSQAVNAADFISQTSEIVNGFITTATNNEISAFNARLNGIEEYTRFTVESEKLITEITGGEWDIRENDANDYFDLVKSEFTSLQQIVANFQASLTALPDVVISGQTILGSFQGGGLVPQTGLFNLHEGEFVIPSNQVENNQTTTNVGGVTINQLEPVESFETEKMLRQSLSPSGGA